MKAFKRSLPLRLRAALLAIAFCVVAVTALISYRLYLRPTTLSIAVGSFGPAFALCGFILAGGALAYWLLINDTVEYVEA